MDAQLSDLRERLSASEAARAEAVRKIDELDNRLFLLSDQVESQKVAMGRRGGAPALPVVTVRPPSETEEPAAEEYAVESAPEAVEVAPRKTLKIEGAAPRLSGEKMASLGVVKLPDKGVPVHSSAGTGTETDPVAAYRAAYAKLMSGRAEEAEGEFRAFVKKWPRHDYADNAQYWLGESFYARKDFPSAAPEFQSVVVRWPSGNKAPDALLKLGYCLLALGETQKGREVLLQVVEHYPRTDAAHLAERRLAEQSETKP